MKFSGDTKTGKFKVTLPNNEFVSMEDVSRVDGWCRVLMGRMCEGFNKMSDQALVASTQKEYLRNLQTKEVPFNS
jgi:hypothetical protein